MNESHKLAEAHYFLSRLAALSSHPQEFSFELSAFLSAARSVLQYALDEAKTKPGGSAWYETQVRNAPAIKYFKDKRDLSIHAKPVVPNRNVSVALTASVSTHASLSLKIIGRDGNVIEERNTTSPIPEPEPQISPSILFSYCFDDWPGIEDVETLCHQYFAAIEAIVKDGQEKSFLSI